MIVVATSDFEVYHGVVNELRDRSVDFTTIEPDDELPETADAVITDAETAESIEEFETVVATPGEPRRAVEEALALLREAGGRLVVGIDPGTKPGVAVLVGELIVSAYHVPLNDAVETVRGEIECATDPLVRIGDGARLEGARIVDELDVPVELVDETGTTPYVGTGARGMGDVLAAVNIARIEGELVESREFEPTDGELQVIKNRSRERSEKNRSIDETLARRVAAGELTLDEALNEHRETE
ncbi:hypothetical protein ACFQH2_14865 [Natronoarchaeum sp. GCM10025703]|uniref:hypothetical protein n=1 Tax=unclassified Natronoarchaeum TaxID=2620183 RepID=UPI00360F8F82